MRFHHVGIVVASLADALPYYSEVLGLRPVGQAVEDPAQESELALLADDRGRSVIELICPTTEDSPVARKAAEGGGTGHVCYEVEEIDAEIERLRAAGVMLVREPTPAVLFDGRRVAFLFLKTRELIELLEAAPA